MTTVKLELSILGSPRPVLNQGTRPVCAAIAVTAAHEFGRGLELAAEALWQHALARGDTSSDGTTLAAMHAALLDTGQPRAAAWPFDATNGAEQAAPKAAGPAPWYRGAVDRHRWNAQEVVEAIEKGTAVVAAVDVTDAFDAADASGVIPDPNPSDTGQGLHAVVCVAFGRTAADVLHILIRNSWGAGWGQGGYAWMSEPHFNAMTMLTATVAYI